MSQQTTEKLRSASSDRLVVDEIDEGYRVYSPAHRNRVYLVAGDEASPTCTCPEFRSRQDESNFWCKHILAVFPTLAGAAQEETSPETSHEAEVTEMTHHDADDSPEQTVTQMTLKRSVSPDGRIDSLSIEFSCAIAPGTLPDQVAKRAQNILGVQGGIASFFLSAHRGDKNGKDEVKTSSTNGDLIPATMLEVTGSRNGNSLFITFDVDGKTMRYFGDRDELAQAISAAGYAREAREIRKGKNLDLPCCVITEESRDGQYTNVVEVLPPKKTNGANGKSRRR